jgi:hypothetical protein
MVIGGEEFEREFTLEDNNHLYCSNSFRIVD